MHVQKSRIKDIWYIKKIYNIRLRFVFNYSDCHFKTGSRNWSNGWSWDAVDDTLITIDNRYAHGITTGFNVSTQEYNTCSATSLSYSDENLSWIEATDYFFNHSKPVTFKLNKRWHFSWVSKQQSSSLTQSAVIAIITSKDSKKNFLLSECHTTWQSQVVIKKQKRKFFC